jgi:hypothetical protein
VVEKVIWNKDTKRPATAAQLDALWARLFADTGNMSEPGLLLDRLIPHEYGNYVVSSCLEVNFALPEWHTADAPLQRYLELLQLACISPSDS